MKTCKTCNEDKPLTEYRQNARKSGLRLDCKECERKSNREHYKRNKGKILAQKKHQRESDPDKFKERDKAWRKANPDKAKNIYKKYRETNSEKVKAYAKDYYEKNKDKYNQWDSERRAQGRLATPSWLTKEQKDYIASLYEFRRNISGVEGREYHVDHIVPLRGENVCGLHVPWNLQVIPAKDNLSKSNSTDHLNNPSE